MRRRFEVTPAAMDIPATKYDRQTQRVKARQNTSSERQKDWIYVCMISMVCTVHTSTVLYCIILCMIQGTCAMSSPCEVLIRIIRMYGQYIQYHIRMYMYHKLVLHDTRMPILKKYSVILLWPRTLNPAVPGPADTFVEIASMDIFLVNKKDCETVFFVLACTT